MAGINFRFYFFIFQAIFYNVSKPFIIRANRKLNLMNLEYANTIFEDLELEYVGIENYYSNSGQSKTFAFKLSSIK